MALQLILGGSGYGKSQFMYEQVIRASIENPDLNYIIIVPEQYTMQVQKKLSVCIQKAVCLTLML